MQMGLYEYLRKILLVSIYKHVFFLIAVWKAR